MMSLFLYRFAFTLLFLFHCCFRFRFLFPFLFWIPDSGFRLFQTPVLFSEQDDASQMPSGITDLVSAPLVSREVCVFSRIVVKLVKESKMCALKYYLFH